MSYFHLQRKHPVKACFRSPEPSAERTKHYLPLVLAFYLLTFSLNSQAETWWAEYSDPLTWPSALDACQQGEAEARIADFEAADPQGMYRYIPNPPNPTIFSDGQEATCEFQPQKKQPGPFNIWVPFGPYIDLSVYLLPDQISFYTTGDEGKPSGECDKTNPCDVITGRKMQRETDFDDGWLSFVRYYDSGSADPGTEIGAHWRHSYDTRMDSLPLLDSGDSVAWPLIIPEPPALRSDDYGSRQDACISGWGDIKSKHRGGAISTATASYSSGVCELSLSGSRVGILSIQSNQGYIPFEPVAGGWGMNDSPIHTVTTANGGYYTFEETAPGMYEEASKYPVRLELSGSDWLFYHRDNTVDRFSDGKLISRTSIDGRELTLTYNATSGRLSTITDDSGNTLQLGYNGNGQIQTLTHPAGQIAYGYDGNYNLISVTYEDTKDRVYHYEEGVSFPHHLTGITDERGIRFARWDYDTNGKAISSKHGEALNANLTTLTHNGTSTTVTDAAGGTRTYNIETKGAFSVVNSITGDKCIDCPRNRMKIRTYDANGYLNEVTDWEGNITDYDYDGRGLQVQRIEAKGVPILERTITTQWHPTLRLPVKITEPDRIIDFMYDTQGRLLERKITPPPP